MELRQLFAICGASSPDDRNVVHGPTYVTGFVPIWNGPASDQPGYELHPLEHEARATFTPDLAIGIAWGMHTDAMSGIGSERRTLNEEWVTADSRCDLPMPKRKIEGEGADARIAEPYVKRAGFEVRDSAE